MLRQLIRVKDVARINCYGTTSLVEKISKLSLGSPSVVSKDVKEPSPVQRYSIRDIPRIPLTIIEPPGQRLLTEINSIVRQEQAIELPSAGPTVEKHAVRLIVIRRKKMKKHKLRKLRKKMKYEWAKVKQRREMRKEKAFRAEIFAQIKEAENFSAEKYVEEKIRKATETPIPRFWKNRRLPQFIIKQKLGIK